MVADCFSNSGISLDAITATLLGAEASRKGESAPLTMYTFINTPHPQGGTDMLLGYLLGQLDKALKQGWLAGRCESYLQLRWRPLAGFPLPQCWVLLFVWHVLCFFFCLLLGSSQFSTSWELGGLERDASVILHWRHWPRALEVSWCPLGLSFTQLRTYRLTRLLHTFR